MLIDTHCHLDFPSFDDDRENIIQRALEKGVSRIIVPGIDLESSTRAIELSQKYEFVSAAVGFHPSDLPLKKDCSKKLAELESIAKEPGVVAIGEIGLDYYRMHSPSPTQQYWLREQLQLAAGLNLPVILHTRDAMTDMLSILDEYCQAERLALLHNRPGVLHSYSGTITQANSAIELGFFLGFTGVVTYKNASEIQQVAASVPLEKMLIETDAPFLSPHPHRGKQNEPSFIIYTAEKIAEIRQEPFNKIAAVSTMNAEALFFPAY